MAASNRPSVTMSQSGYATPEEAEQAFYAAFEKADLQAMMAVWADSDFVECIHPMGSRVQGRAAVLDSWQEIFEGGLRVQLRLSNVHRTQDSLLAIHVVYEHLRVPGQPSEYPPVIATNIYQLLEQGWFMVQHHASPSPAEEQETDEENVSEPHSGERLH